MDKLVNEAIKQFKEDHSLNEGSKVSPNLRKDIEKSINSKSKDIGKIVSDVEKLVIQIVEGDLKIQHSYEPGKYGDAMSAVVEKVLSDIKDNFS